MMIYGHVADYSKKFAHLAIEWTVPRNGEIALVSAAAGWYAHQCSMTYSQSVQVNLITQQFQQVFPYGGTTLGYLAAPFVVPWTSPSISVFLGIGVTMSVSAILNLAHRLIVHRADPAKPKDITENVFVQTGSEKSSSLVRQAPMYAAKNARQDILGEDPLQRGSCWPFCC